MVYILGALTAVSLLWAQPGIPAFETLFSKAQAGNTQAQFDLGFLYGQGIGVVQDEAAAKDWWLRAAQGGHSGAQTNLGILLLAENNTSGALAWLQQAADQNGSLAKCHLAELYAATGSDANLSRAKKLAAEGFQGGATRCQKIWYVYGLDRIAD